MTSYRSIAKDMWHFSASYVVRDEDVLAQLFLTIGGGGEWNSKGEMKECGYHEDVSKPESLAKCAYDQATLSKEVFDPEKGSRWFDHYHVEILCRQAATPYVRNSYVSKGYGALTKIPANIAQDWVQAVNRCIAWVDTYNLESWFAHNLESTERSHFGSCFETIRDKQAYIDHPEWKKIKEEHKEKTKGMEFIDAVMFKDPAYTQMHADLCEYIREKVKPNALRDCTDRFNELKECVEIARNRLKELGKDLTDLGEAPTFKRDMSKPDWYVENKDRKDEFNIFKLSEDWSGNFHTDVLSPETIMGFVPKPA